MTDVAIHNPRRGEKVTPTPSKPGRKVDHVMPSEDTPTVANAVLGGGCDTATHVAVVAPNATP